MHTEPCTVEDGRKRPVVAVNLVCLLDLVEDADGRLALRADKPEFNSVCDMILLNRADYPRRVEWPADKPVVVIKKWKIVLEE